MPQTDFTKAFPPKVETNKRDFVRYPNGSFTYLDELDGMRAEWHEGQIVDVLVTDDWYHVVGLTKDPTDWEPER